MNTAKLVPLARRSLVAVTLLAALAACQTRPEVRTQSAPSLNVAKYTTYGFMDKPSTDTAGYTTLTTRYLEEAVGREMQARGFTRSQNPDLLVNFNVATKDKIESRPGPNVGVGYGGWRRGYGWGLGVGGYNDIRNFTEGTLTVDLVDRSRNELVWSGTAVGRLNKAAMDKPQQTIDQTVDLIFAKFPKPDVTAQVN